MNKRHRQSICGRIWVWFFGALVGSGILACQGQLVFMYGTTVAGGGGASDLVLINPADGSLVRTIGSVGYAVNGLEWNWADGKLYGSTSWNDPNFRSGLIEIDPVTGAGSPIGSGFGVEGTVVCITSDSLGRLFGWIEPAFDDLALIDTSTGLATRVGESGLDTGRLGLAFDGSDNLFLVNYDGSVYSLDPTTGSSTDLNYDLVTAHHGDFNPSDGYYYGIAESDSNSRTLVVADLTLTSGQVIRTPTSIDNLHAVTFAPVPEPSHAALVVGLLVLGSAMLQRRYSRH